MPNKKTNAKQKTQTYETQKTKKYGLKEASTKSCFNLVKEIKYFDIISKLWLILYYIYIYTYIFKSLYYNYNFIFLT